MCRRSYLHQEPRGLECSLISATNLLCYLELIISPLGDSVSPPVKPGG